MSKVTPRSLIRVVAAIGLLVVVVMPCMAVNPYTSTLTGNYGPFTLISTVYTTPEMIEGVAWYKFYYELRYTGTTYNLKTFNINNPTGLEYKYAGNSQAVDYFTVQPDWNTVPTAAKWTATTYMPPQTVYFWFYARSPEYQVVTCSITGASSKLANGNALGIATPIPEPTAMAGLAVGISGTMGLALRRARLRRK